MAEYMCELMDRPLEQPQMMLARRERVVRCRDCEHAHPCPLAGSKKIMCAFHDEMFVNPNDFCSWGEECED